ncbi:VWA domain-containing protein [Streptomyces sp. NPDC050121]|uniref:VWA domain-containing protein n=1 Tax=Streptomyces sp. NPDC050121 TaxID=3365601 RepID=UPI0037B1BC5A
MGNLSSGDVRNLSKCSRGFRARPERPARRSARAAAALLAAVLLIGAGVPASGAPGAAGAAGRAAGDASDAINLAVAVDESNSLSADDVDRERDAAQRIALAEISPRSRLTVLGFASADNDEQQAVDEVCPPTALNAVAREKIGDCVGKLDRRGKGEGTGTDFPAAIRQGIARLSEESVAGPRILFLLTDGVLDVSDSPAYGADAASRKANGGRELRAALAEARAAKVQIWPLGFGSPDPDALHAMAAGGYQGACVDLAQARPASQVVKDSTALGEAVQKAFASARCMIYEATAQDTPPATIKLRISPLATLATIVVSKGDPAVRVRIRAPGGQEIDGTRDDGVSSYELTGAEQEVESLRMVAPRPGTWTVDLSAPEGHRDRLASVGVQWRGALRSSIVMTPATPHPGEQATVGLQLQTWNGEPADLDVLKVSATLDGAGFTPRPVRLADDGRGEDEHAGDGRFTGTVTIPRTATDRLKVTGVLTAIGLTADHRPFVTGVAAENAQVQAHVGVFDATVHAGESVPVTLKASDDSTSARILHLILEDSSRGDLTVTPARVRLDPGQTRTVRAEVRVGSGVRPGPVSAKIVVYDTGQPARVLDARLLTLRVTPMPGWPEQHWKLLLTLGLLLVAAAAWTGWRLLERKRVHNVRGLVLTLLVPDEDGQGERPVSTIQVRTDGPEYRFGVVAGGGTDPRLVPDRQGRFAVRRDAQRMARLRTPETTGTAIAYGRTAPLTGELRLQVDSTRSRVRRPSAGLGLRLPFPRPARSEPADRPARPGRPARTAPGPRRDAHGQPPARAVHDDTPRVPAAGADAYDPDL